MGAAHQTWCKARTTRAAPAGQPQRPSPSPMTGPLPDSATPQRIYQETKSEDCVNSRRRMDEQRLGCDRRGSSLRSKKIRGLHEATT